MNFLLPILLLLITSFHVSSSVSTVSPGFRFNSSQENGNLTAFLTSPNAQFSAGFIPASTGFILAIAGLDPTLAPLDTVWSANPGRPFTGICTFVFDQGRLRVVRKEGGGEVSLWESESDGRGDVLELTDTGNLILRNATAPVWQSFDHPTDVLMQGQNLTQQMQLVSESGAYRMRLLNDRLLLLADSEPYWAIAALRELKNNSSNSSTSSGSGVYLRIQDGYLGMYQTENVRVHFLPFSSMNRAASNQFTRRARLQGDGNLIVYYFQDGRMVQDYAAISDPCRFPSACGPFGICSTSISSSGFTCSCPKNVSVSTADPGNPSGGCRKSAGPTSSPVCSVGSDEFVEIHGADYFANDFTSLLSPAAGEVTGLDGCRRRCLERCTCRAFFFRNDTGACFHTEFQRSLLATSNLQDSAFIRVPSPAALAVAGERSSRDGRRRRQRRALGVSLLVLVVVLSSAVIGVYCWRRRLRRKEASGFSDEDSSTQEISVLRGRHSQPSC